MITSQVFLESYRFQHVHSVHKGHLLIGIPKKLRVIESGAEYALVAMTDQAVRITICIQYSEEVRREFACYVFDGEILLMIAHHGHQDLFWQRKKLLHKVAENRRRPLGQVDNGL